MTIRQLTVWTSSEGLLARNCYTQWIKSNNEYFLVRCIHRCSPYRFNKVRISLHTPFVERPYRSTSLKNHQNILTEWNFIPKSKCLIVSWIWSFSNRQSLAYGLIGFVGFWSLRLAFKLQVPHSQLVWHYHYTCIDQNLVLTAILLANSFGKREWCSGALLPWLITLVFVFNEGRSV